MEEEASKETTENADGVVSCICNKVYENDEQMMAQCEKCDQWQHVKCLFGKEDEGLLPDKYYCPSCAPELYPSITPSAPISISIPTTPTTPTTTTTTITITTPEALPVTPGEHDTESSSNNNNPENSPVKVDEANSPPNKKRKVVPVCILCLSHFFSLLPFTKLYSFPLPLLLTYVLGYNTSPFSCQNF